ncbi:hypothetical protein [uncultured Microbulbifer sp.]|uniref:hypothetical protein n=1 Tax=uncultured Microbulbifer sp. TaxID=348147 RepID=UPI00263701D3|nr:hypothetical protein [uncultured Microbulbifer sp.]
MNNEISAFYQANRVSPQKFFLYLTNGLSQFELALLSVVGSKYDYLIYTTLDLASIIDDFNVPKNVTVSDDFRSVKALLLNCGGVITTVGHLSPVLPEGFRSLVKAVVAAELPIVEVPHGLYQWGYNLSDDSKVIKLASNTFGAGREVPTYADHQITWFGNLGVGYPRSSGSSVRKAGDSVVPDYAVITTNTNWYMYGDEHQRSLIQAIFQKARVNSHELFIWCMHPSEVVGKGVFSYINSFKPSNLFIYGLTEDIYFHGLDTTEDVISRAKYGISTVSTCLIDYERFGIPVHVFHTNNLSEIYETLSGVSFFSNAEQLVASSPSVLSTNQLKTYDVKEFDRLLSKFSGSYAANERKNKLLLGIL